LGRAENTGEKGVCGKTKGLKTTVVVRKEGGGEQTVAHADRAKPGFGIEGFQEIVRGKARQIRGGGSQLPWSSGKRGVQRKEVRGINCKDGTIARGGGNSREGSSRRGYTKSGDIGTERVGCAWAPTKQKTPNTPQQPTQGGKEAKEKEENHAAK